MCQLLLLLMPILIQQVEAFVLHCIGTMCDRWHYLFLVVILIIIVICSVYASVKIIKICKAKQLANGAKNELPKYSM